MIPLALRQRLRKTRPFLAPAFEAISRIGSSTWIRQDQSFLVDYRIELRFLSGRLEDGSFDDDA
jgi:hypothetical protein